MKSWIKKTITLALVGIMLTMALAGCGGGNNASESGGFSVTFGKPTGLDQDMVNETLARWESLSDVPIEWAFLSGDGGSEALSLRFAAGDYPEVIMGNYLQTTDVSKYAANGILIPLDEYINETDTPNLYNFFQKYPRSAAANRLPDGHMYSLFQFEEFEPQYVENVFFINKVWLDKLGLEIPTTTDELKEVLRAFKTGDPNGNGEADEIGMTFQDGHGFSYPEVMLSCWGVAAKHGVYDSFCTVQNGVVKFAPMLDEWKEMIKYYRDLYAEGLLDLECFTHTGEVFGAKLSNPVSRVGIIWSKTNPMANADEYVAIPPLRATSKDPVWHIHPGIIGNRNLFSITTACKNPQAVMKWIDKFYSFEEAIQNEYGAVGRVFTINEEGIYTWNDPEEGKSLSSLISDNCLLSGFPSCITREDLDTRVERSSIQLAQEETYKLYEQFINPEPWPRPYYSVEEANRIAELTTDIFKTVNEKKAKWIVGSEDVEAGWEDYKQSLKNMGIEELMQINQGAYDRFQNAMTD